MPKSEGNAFIYNDQNSDIHPGDGMSSIDNKERFFTDSYEIMTMPGSEELVHVRGESLFEMVREIVNPLFEEITSDPRDFQQKIDDEEVRLIKDLENPQTVFVAMVEKGSRALVGFTYATPSPLLARDSSDIGDGKISGREYLERQERTAQVGWTIIDQEHRSKGGWSHMMSALEDSLIESGYQQMTRVVRVADNYADKVRGRYKGRIIREFPLVDTYGPQVFLRINLK